MLIQLIIIGILAAWTVFLWNTKRKHETFISTLGWKARSDYRLKQRLAMGLYFQFMKEDEERKYSNVFDKKTPLEFENFIADIMEHHYGGKSYVTASSGDYGVDVEIHTKDGEVIYGQVKCYANDLPFDPIAKVHSNMVKFGADRGFIITTGGYTKNAKNYAEGLNIQLFNGIQLADIYLSSLQSETENIADTYSLTLQ